MTGLDCLKEELKNKGFSSTQVNAKVVAGVLDIISKADGKYLEQHDLDEELSHKRHTLRELEKGIAYQQINLRMREHQLEDKARRVNEAIEEMREYIEQFNKSLLECDTADGKDAMRAAQLFVNSVDVGTKYDNTAFIIGLSSILTKGAVDGVKELKAVNPKLFSGKVR